MIREKISVDISDAANEDLKFSFFKSKFLYSPYFHYIVPALFFLIMLFVSLMNRAIGDYGVESDFYSGYAPQAKELLEGNLVIDPFKGPLYQIVLSIAGLIFGRDFFVAGKIINVIFSGLALYFVSRSIGILLNKESAFLATLIIAVNYTFLTYTYSPDTDMLFMALYISALYFILESELWNNKYLLIAGILSSLAYLTRYTAISLIVFVILIFLIKVFKWYRSDHSGERSNLFPFKPLLNFFIPVLIVSVAWGTISYKKTGYFFYNLNYENTAFAVYKPESMSKDEWNTKYKDNFKSMSNVAFADVGKFSKKIFLINFPSYFKKDVTRLLPKYLGIFVIFGIIFFFFKFKTTRINQKYFFIASILFYLQILLIFYSERFSLPLLPFYCFMILWFLSIDFLNRFNFKISNIKIFGIMLFILIFYNLYTSYRMVKEEINNGPIEILAIRDWVEKNKSNELTGKLIMSRKPHIAYYLDMETQVTPFVKNYDEYIKNVKDNNIDYVFINEKEADYLSDENLKQKLLNYSDPPVELEVLTYTTNPIAVLYKVKKSSSR